ncbi:MAG: hypothetical protein J6J93_04450 [Muribaculaceae bacterium]|nr:hypothetical protein [Muribaculaceae bacterium]
MATVTFTDLVQASATFEGRTVARIAASGFNSINEVLLAVRHAAGGITGLLELSVRNATQGWRQERSLYIMPS